LIEWYMWVELVLALAVGLACIGFAVAGRGPNDITVIGLGLVEVAMLAQTVIGAIAPATGNQPTGSLLEWWMYMVAALLIPPAAIFWALVERNRWANLILATAALGIAVMVWRMYTIWVFQQVV